MKIPLVDLTRQYEHIKYEIDQKIQEVLESGIFIAGENVRLFEEEFSRFCDVKYGIAVASGSDALALSLKALGIKKGDEVITSANTFIATLDAVSHNQAIPVLVDIESETYNIDTSKIEEKISDKTKAVIPVHLYGHPVDMDPVRERAESYGLYVVEDACQAHGAEYKDLKVGGLSDCACFSFYPSKNLGAYGDGGIVVTNNEEIAQSIMALRNYGESTKYHHSLIGYNSRLDEIQAAVLRVKLRHLYEWIEARRKNAKNYSQLLHEVPEVTVPIEKDHAKHVYHLYVIRSKRRKTLRDYLYSKGVSTQIHYPIPTHLQKAYEPLGLKEGMYPHTEQCAKEVLSLPMFPELTAQEIECVCESIRSFFKKA